MEFFQSFIATHSPNCLDKCVRFDKGGELGGNLEVHTLFEKAGHEVEVTAPDSSSENGQVERPHCTIADEVRAMLHSA